jgi:hypothetical protein
MRAGEVRAAGEEIVAGEVTALAAAEPGMKALARRLDPAGQATDRAADAAGANSANRAADTGRDAADGTADRATDAGRNAAHSAANAAQDPAEPACERIARLQRRDKNRRDPELQEELELLRCEMSIPHDETLAWLSLAKANA